jgi:uncharacterized protein YciI
MREQAAWEDHARFMDELAATGFVVLGGPLGAGERQFLLLCDAPDEAAVRARLDQDPWVPAGLLVTDRIEPWTALLEHLGTVQPQLSVRRGRRSGCHRAGRGGGRSHADQAGRRGAPVAARAGRGSVRAPLGDR